MKKALWIILLFTSQAIAQKLPNLQTKSLRAPAAVKIDGKATEWNNNFQAYNTATSIFYTMANNAEFIYLTAHIKDPAVINRITNNGFTFKIYKNENPQDKDVISITLPYSANKYFNLDLSKPTRSDVALEKEILKNNNALLSKHHKYMIVKGIPGLDSVAVYNDAGIGFAEAFDSNEDYTVELQVPVKYINLLPGDSSKFLYHMVINGLPKPSGPDRGVITFSSGGGTTFTAPKDITPEQQAQIEEGRAQLAKKYAPTDFKAEYTLVK
ncbi:hypothetical protein GCM10027049_19610 [Mucilaginibacter puniceus]